MAVCAARLARPAARLSLANQLRATLDAFWPGAARTFAAVDSPIGLAFLRRYPSPTSAARLSEAASRRFCRAEHYSGRRTPAELLARVSAAAQGHTSELTTAAMAEVVNSLVAVLTTLADNSRHANLWACGIYTAARIDRKPYDPQLHLGALKVPSDAGVDAPCELCRVRGTTMPMGWSPSART